MIQRSQRRGQFWKVAAVLGLVAVATALIYFSPLFSASQEPTPTYTRLEMGGTSTVFVIVENRWKRKYVVEKGVQLVYESTGSTAGVEHLLDGTITVAFTHGALTPEQRRTAGAKGGGAVHIPVLFFGVAPVYHLKELKGKAPLNLTGELLADIFSGKITRWNDPAVEKVNSGVVLPPTPITVVHRADSSGTTLVFTEYLDAVTAANGTWRSRMGKPAPKIVWPTGRTFVPEPRNLRVATRVYETEGAIGYVDRMFTAYDEMKLDYAAVQNKDRTGFVRAEPENMTAAASGLLADLPDDLVFDLANKSGPAAYPITGAIYAICFRNQSRDRRQLVVDFLHWAVHEGQADVAKMTYAPLPPELVRRIDQQLEMIEVAP